MRKSFKVTGTGIGLVVLIAVATVGCPSADTATLRVWNNTSKTITGVYCTPTSSSSWGDNLITGVMEPGTTLDITGFESDNYDMLAVFSDDTDAEEDDVYFGPGEIYTWNVLFSLPSGKAETEAAGANP
jgi:hypothetical protein